MRISLLLIFTLLTGLVSAQKQWTLQECVSYAMEHNINLQQADLNEILAEVGLKQSKGNMMPNLNASASHAYNWGRNIDPITNTITTQSIQRNSMGISSSVTLFNGFQRRNGLKQSMVNLESVQLQNEQMRNDMALNIANAFLNILFNQEFYKIADANLEATNAQAELIEKLFDAGQVPEGDLFEVQAQQATDEAALLNAENNLLISKLMMTQLLQLSSEEGQNFDIAVPEIESIDGIAMPSSVQLVIDKALADYPSMEFARKNVEFNSIGVDIAQGARMPNLGLNYSLGTGFSDQNVVGRDLVTIVPVVGTVAGTNQSVFGEEVSFFTAYETKPFWDQFNDNINHGLVMSLSIPIFNGWSTENNIQRAQVNLMNAELDLENSTNSLIQDIERAWADAEVAKKNYDAAVKSVDASSKAHAYATVQYEQGIITLVEFNQVRIRLDNAQANLIRNKYDYVFKAKILDFYQGIAITL